MFRILVADDEDFIRRGIIAILKRNLPSETEPCFLEASDGYEAFRQTDTMPVELVITDIRMPGASGLDFIKKLRTIHPDTPVIVIYMKILNMLKKLFRLVYVLISQSLSTSRN